MSSYVLVLHGVRHSMPIDLKEAERRQAEHAKFGTHYEIERVDEVVETKRVKHGPAEVVEDVGCAGGACTL